MDFCRFVSYRFCNCNDYRVFKRQGITPKILQRKLQNINWISCFYWHSIFNKSVLKTLIYLPLKRFTLTVANSEFGNLQNTFSSEYSPASAATLCKTSISTIY